MKYLWGCIEKTAWRAETKYRAARLVFGVVFALSGLAAWLIVRLWALNTWDWLFCFVGYPVLFSQLAVFLYSCNHGFRDKK